MKKQDENVGATVDCIRVAGKKDLCIAKSSFKYYVISKGDSMVSRSVNHEPIEKRTPVLFEPDKREPWRTSLLLPGKLLTLKQEKSSKADSEVLHTTNNIIFYQKGE